MDCQVWHRGHHCKKSFLWHWITAQLYVSNAAFVVYQHTLAHTRTFKKKKKKRHAHVGIWHAGTLQRTHISQREKWRNQAERILGLVRLYITAIFTSAQSFLFLPCMQSYSCVCIMTLIHQNLPFVCPVFCIYVCVCVTWFYILLRCLIRQWRRRTRRLA